MKQVLDYIRQQELIEKGDHVVVGLSGGADSVCLFFVLRSLQEELDFTMSAVHVNHNLRGKEAARDEAFVKKMCETHRVPLGLYSVDVRKLAAEEKLSLEEAGRNVRRRALEEYCSEHGGTKIALAHHQNDLAETMVYHLARGTGLSGLVPIRPLRGSIIRPLLCMNREEIEHYLKSRHIEYVTDSTNEEDHYTRNKIRHHVLDYLVKEVNPRTVSHMAQTAETIGQVQDYLAEEIKNVMSSCVRVTEEGLFLKLELFSCHPVLQNGVIRECIAQTSGGLKDITREHLAMISRLVKKQVGKEISLPGDLFVRREYDGLVMGIAGNQKQQEAVYLSLTVPGELKLGETEVFCSFVTDIRQGITEKTYTKWMDYDKIKDTLVFRTRRQGDYLVINREGGKKKLKDYFIDSKIPQNERDQIWLLTVGSEVLWVCGYRLSEAYKVLPETKNIVKIQIQGGKFHE